MRPFGDFELDIRTIGTGTINGIPHSDDDCVTDHTADCDSSCCGMTHTVGC